MSSLLPLPYYQSGVRCYYFLMPRGDGFYDAYLDQNFIRYDWRTSFLQR